MESPDDENESLSDSLVNSSAGLAASADNNSILVHSDCSKKVDVRFPVILPAGGRAVLEETTSGATQDYNQWWIRS